VGAKSVETLRLSFADGKRRAWLFAQDIVDNETQNDDGFDITVRWTANQRSAFERL